MDTTELVCVNHPKRATRVRCSNCGDPICVSCMRESAVGMKCPRCAALPKSALRMGKPRYYVAAGLAGLASSMVAGAVLTFVSLGLLGIILPALAGLAIGSVISRAARGLGHRPFQLIAAITTAAGLVAGPALLGAPLGFILSPPSLLGIAIAAGVAAVRVGR